MKTRTQVPDLTGQLDQLGVSTDDAELLELMPLVEMVWADGLAADAELSLLDRYIQDLIRRLNTADRATAIDISHVEGFVLPFLQRRPDPQLLQTLRNIGVQMVLRQPDAAERRQRLLAACLDIGSAAVKQYPYPMGERFSSDEKRTFFEILHALESAQRDN